MVREQPGGPCKRHRPLPDDFWLVPDAASPTGAHVEFGVPDREPDVVRIFEALAAATAGADGFSPIGAIALELTDAPQLASLPRTPEVSLDPLASIGLFDLTPGSPSFRVSVATTDHIPHDLLAIKEQVLASDPPAFCVTGCPVPCPACGVAARTGAVAAIVTGLWEAPDWRDGQFLARDENGAPVVTRTRFIRFTLALPAAARETPVPVTMYQHGSPGETQGEQLAFLRLIDGLGALDVLPLGQPDGRPDLDVAAPRTYVGISQGAIHGQAFVTYAPELRAAALIVGGSRLTETLIHQDTSGTTPLLPGLLTVFPNLRPADVWAGLALFQLAFDPQDSHNHAAFLYRAPVEVAGTTRKASVLVVEGVSDPQVPNNSTRSLAWLLGPIPHLEPVQQAVPFLTPQTGPIRANVDAATTSAFMQYVPAGVPGIPPTPGCVGQPNGHFCAQSAAESELQRTVFFQSALTDPAPVIVNPFAE